MTLEVKELDIFLALNMFLIFGLFLFLVPNVDSSVNRYK